MNLTFAAKRALIAGFALLGIVAAPDAARAADIRGVTFSPGEWSKTVPGVPVGSSATDELRIYATAWPMVCDVPDVQSQVKPRLVGMASGTGAALRALLSAMEAEDRSTPAGTRNAIAHIGVTGVDPAAIDANRQLIFHERGAWANSRWSAGQELRLIAYSNCLGLQDARAFVEQVRQIIRLHLGMPVAPAPARGIEPPRRP